MKIDMGKLVPLLRSWAGYAARACAGVRGAAKRILPRLRTRCSLFARHVHDRLFGGRVSKRSLRLRLIVFFSLFLATAWIAAALFAWKECREHMDEFFDSQQMLLAKSLAVADFSHRPGDLPKTGRMLSGVGKKAIGDLDDEAIAFAVFSADGGVVLTDGQKGRHFPFERERRGFAEARLADGDDTWRMLWIDAVDSGYVIAVGQEMEYRRDMALEVMGKQLAPWLLLLPVLLLGLYVLLTREFAPLHAMASDLRSRAPGNTAPLDTKKAPSEVFPLVEAVNGFFARTDAMLIREKSFISDAAHELRTPLAGLRIQAQVAAQPGIAAATRNEALEFLKKGIDRCGRLVDQLLALSRLEAMRGGRFEAAPAGLFFGPVAWAACIDDCMAEYRPKIQARGIAIEAHAAAPGPVTQGYPALVSMLIRNLFENAAAYTPEQGRIRINLEHDRLVMQNDCAVLTEEYAARLGERFFRPPGQEEPGSGLGLSIVGRIAEIHGFLLDIRTEGGEPGPKGTFIVTVQW